MAEPAPTIRDATAHNVPAITDIYRHAVLHTLSTFDTDPPSLDKQTAWFHSHGGRYPVLVAELDGHVVGWASLSVWIGRGACLHTTEASVYVAEPFQHRGIGSLLLASLIERARALEYHVLIAQVVGPNRVSLEMMRRVGFEDAGLVREAGWKFGQWLDLFVLQLILPIRTR